MKDYYYQIVVCLVHEKMCLSNCGQQIINKTLTKQSHNKKSSKNCHDITVEEISPENRPKVPKEIAQTGWTMNGKIN